MSSTTSRSPDSDDPGLAKIAQLVHKEAGLVISQSKIAMVRSRLRGRLAKLNLVDFDGYCDFVSSAQGAQERAEMISALTTNVSSFFREPHHFDTLQKEVWPELTRKLKSGGRVRIWSAGCSTGQEPYSLAMSALETDSVFASGDFRILATDIDLKVLQKSVDAIYAHSQIAGIPEHLRSKYFTQNPDESWTARPALTELVSFKQLNLTKEWPMRGQFELIFCRNVVIYFDEATQAKLWPKFQNALAPDGRLFIGHSERIVDPETCGFVSKGTTGYQKVTKSTGAIEAKKGDEKWH